MLIVVYGQLTRTSALYISVALCLQSIVAELQAVLYTFITATLCVSAVLAVGRCPSVRPPLRILYQNGSRYRQTSSSPGSLVNNSYLMPAGVMNRQSIVWPCGSCFAALVCTVKLWIWWKPCTWTHVVVSVPTACCPIGLQLVVASGRAVELRLTCS